MRLNNRKLLCRWWFLSVAFFAFLDVFRSLRFTSSFAHTHTHRLTPHFDNFSWISSVDYSCANRTKASHHRLTLKLMFKAYNETITNQHSKSTRKSIVILFRLSLFVSIIWSGALTFSHVISLSRLQKKSVGRRFHCLFSLVWHLLVASIHSVFHCKRQYLILSVRSFQSKAFLLFFLSFRLTRSAYITKP